jgi:hypothetical protein
LTAYRNLRSLSAKTEEGVGAWLSEVVGGGIEAGSRLLEDVDYATYAAAEAVLGWLNWRMVVKLDVALSPPALAGPLFDGIKEALTRQKVAILHLKMTDRCESGFLEAGVCRNSDQPEVTGDLSASPAKEHEITLNLRARANPEQLTMAVAEACERLPGQVRFTRQDCFQPSAPRPEHRFRHVVRPGS